MKHVIDVVEEKNSTGGGRELFISSRTENFVNNLDKIDISDDHFMPGLKRI